MIDAGSQVMIFVYNISDSVLRVATLPSLVGISRFLSLDSTGPAGVGHCVSRITL